MRASLCRHRPRRYIRNISPARESSVQWRCCCCRRPKNSFKAAEAFVQIHLHALLHCKGAYAANSMANVLRYGVMGQHLGFSVKLRFVFRIIDLGVSRSNDQNTAILYQKKTASLRCVSLPRPQPGPQAPPWHWIHRIPECGLRFPGSQNKTGLFRLTCWLLQRKIFSILPYSIDPCNRLYSAI